MVTSSTQLELRSTPLYLTLRQLVKQLNLDVVELVTMVARSTT